jgi:hypothetical protein
LANARRVSLAISFDVLLDDPGLQDFSVWFLAMLEEGSGLVLG